jgi:hypothetical protein
MSRTFGGDSTSNERRVPVLYIGGEGRSGSTILSEVLANLPGFVPVGEILGVWQAVHTDERCGCGAPFSSCALWSAVGDRAFGGWSQVDLGRRLAQDQRYARVPRLPQLLLASAGLRQRADLAEYGAALGRLYRAVRDVTGASIIVDSTKNPAYARLLQEVSDLDVHYVHLVRDSRGVANSWSKDGIVIPEYVDHPELAGKVIRSQAPWKTALRWNAVNLVFPPLTPGHRRRRVNYEALVDDPVGTVSGILEFLGATARDARRRINAVTPFRSTGNHTIGGNPVRFEVGPIDLRADTEWRVRLTATQKAVVGALTAPLLVRYGYPVRESLTETA